MFSHTEEEEKDDKSSWEISFAEI